MPYGKYPSMMMVEQPLMTAERRRLLRRRWLCLHRQLRQLGADCQVLAVSKRQSAADIQCLYSCGQRAFGESYCQEAQSKMAALSGKAIDWHFIGPIQSNKTRHIAALFDWVHSVDRLSLVARLARQRPAEKPPLRVFVQINISAEQQKSGVALADLQPLLQAVLEQPRLHLQGLMAIPAADVDPQPAFDRLRRLQIQLLADGFPMAGLSLGMSADYPAAVAAGATWLRIGSALFGRRL